LKEDSELLNQKIYKFEQEIVELKDEIDEYQEHVKALQ